MMRKITFWAFLFLLGSGVLGATVFNGQIAGASGRRAAKAAAPRPSHGHPGRSVPGLRFVAGGPEQIAFDESADLLRRLGRSDEARTEYERALQLAESEPERRFLQRRVSEATA